MDGVRLPSSCDFEADYEEAREWVSGAAAQDELERLCQSAREAKNEAA